MSKAKSGKMNDDAKRELKPKLRFPEFDQFGDWDTETLSQLASRVTDRNADGEHIRVLTNSAEHGILDQRDFFEKDIANQGNLENYFVVEQGDYVYNPRVSTFAPVGPVSKNKLGTGVMSPLYTVFRFENSSNDFYEHYFKTTKWHAYLRRVSNMGARHDRMSITNDDLMEMPLPFPDPKEQQKITDCLSSLDELIAAHSRKLDALKAHKKGLMQQLFPREGKAHRRFLEQSDWTPDNFDNAVFFQEGPGIMAVDFHDQGIPLIRLSGLAGQTVSLEGCNFLDPNKVAQKWEHFRLEVNDLLVSCSASFGRPTIVNKVAAGALFYTGLIRFRPKDHRLSRGYLEAYLGCPHFQKQAESFAVGGGIKHFGPTHLKQMKIPIPPPAEQERIALCLGSASDLIASQAQMIEGLKTHKKGLMQKLFPHTEGR